jgi:3-hydroxyisobutyrate dehydrogenase-like beta-hydroxyacid dehydrogenase
MTNIYRDITEPIAICGLGNMGAAIAQRLVLRWQVTGYDRSQDRCAEAGRGGVQIVNDVAALAGSPIVLLSLPAPEISLSVAQTLLPHLRPGTILVETSTVNPSDMASLEETMRLAGVRVVDAAILSGVSQMASGAATLLLGGAKDDIAQVMPVLAELSSRQIYFGGVGTGMAAKVINNAVAHAVMVILVEAGAMAAANDVPVDGMAELLRDPEAGLMRPLTHRFIERIRTSNFDGGMPTEAARKDSALALRMAQASNVPLFAIQAAHTVYELALSQDLARLDYSSIARLWEEWTGSSLNREATVLGGSAAQEQPE